MEAVVGWKKRGYYKVSVSKQNLPKNKDVIVMFPGSNNISHSSGHIGFVGSAYMNNNLIVIQVYGANQGKNLPVKTVAGCPNESVMTVTTSSFEGLEFWRKDNAVLFN